MTITSRHFGTFADKEVELYTLDNGWMKACISNFGGVLTQLHMPDGEGRNADVVLGFDSLQDYLPGSLHFGAVIGRCANRIAAGRFELDGEVWNLDKNERETHHLHGGATGFHKRLWNARIDDDEKEDRLVLERISAHMEEGYPGELMLRISYGLNSKNELRMEFHAETDRLTIVNLTGHSYFNLAGHDAGTVAGHELMIDAGVVTEVDDDLIPTGRLLNVKGGPLDFTTPRLLEDAFRNHEAGYDYNYILEKGETPAAVLRDPESGRTMELYTDAPGLQFYTGHFIPDKTRGKNGCTYRPFSGLCLEPQDFPNAVNIPEFPSVILRPGLIWRRIITYRFSVSDG